MYENCDILEPRNRTKYAYDGEGRLCAVRNFNGATEQYLYGPSGARVAKGTPISSGTLACAVPTRAAFAPDKQFLLGLGGQQVTELDGSGNWLHSNVEMSGFRATYSSTSPIFSFQLSDQVGSRRILVDATGSILQSCKSLPFGDGETCSTTPTEQLFTGKERDQESGNDYFEARYYSSATGRFMSPDFSEEPEPTPFADRDDPQSFNLYAYVLNNPLSRKDPDGHWCFLGIGNSCAPDPCGKTPNCVSVTAKPDPPKPWNPHGTEQPRNWAQKSVVPVVHFLDQHPWMRKMMGPDCPDPSNCIANDVMPWGPTGGLGAEAEIKTANELVSATLKRSKSWAGELANETYASLKAKAASGNIKAAKMVKLIKQSERLMEKVGGEALTGSIQKVKMLASQARYSEALGAIQEAEASGEACLELLLMKAQLLQLADETSSLEEVEAALKAALSLSPSSVPALLEMGWFELNVRDNPTEARRVFESALQIQSELNGELIEGLTSCYLELSPGSDRSDVSAKVIASLVREKRESEE